MNDLTNLEQLASHLIDAVAVDWTSAKAEAPTVHESSLVGGLHLIAQIAACHRLLHADTPVVRMAPRGATGLGVRWRHLRLVERVAEGAFGEVYRAWDESLDREVAVKFLKGVQPASGSGVVNEGRLLARIRHPNVVTVFGADQTEGRVGIWMEFVHGRSLSDVLAQDGTFNAVEAAAIGRDICRALGAIHAAGQLHRDIKAQNVMRERGGRILVMDFGTSLEASAIGDRAALAGTPTYLAPEVLGGATPSVQSDLYSLGVLLFRLVTGAYPVAGRTLAEVRTAHARTEMGRLAELRPDLPTAFVEAVERALAVEPRRRFESADVFAKALRRAGDDTPGGRLTSRRRLRERLGLVAAVVVIVASFVWWRSTAPPSFETPPSLVTESGGADNYVPSWISEFDEWDQVDWTRTGLSGRYVFSLTNSFPALFSAAPMLEAGGALRFGVWANAVGSATVTITLTDRRRPLGLPPASTSRSFLMVVHPTRHPPTAGPDRYEALTDQPLVVGPPDPPAPALKWPAPVAIGARDFSVSFLVATRDPGGQPLLSQQPTCNAPGSWRIDLIDERANEPGGRVLFEGFGAVPGHMSRVLSHRRVDDGAAHAVTLTREGPLVSLFVDGVLNRQHVAAQTLEFSETAAVTVGGDDCPHAESRRTRAHGSIDEITFFSRALTRAEVQRLHLGGVLLNDFNSVGDRMTAELVDRPTHGTVDLRPDGTFTYHPAPGFAGTETFTYRARNADGEFSPPAAVTIVVRPSVDGLAGR